MNLPEPYLHKKFRYALGRLTQANQRLQLAQSIVDDETRGVCALLNEMERVGIDDSVLSIHYRINLLGQHKPEWFECNHNPPTYGAVAIS